MRTSMAYFAGVGTVIAAVAVGLGGGLIISNIVSPREPKVEMSKLEQRMSERPIQATNVSREPVSNVAVAAPVAAPAKTSTQSEPATTQPQAAQAAVGAPPAASQPGAAPVAQATASEKTNSEQPKAPEAAFAKARDSDLKPRDADVKTRDADARAERREARRAAEERRRAERRQLWTERRRPRQDQELREVEASVRQETEQSRGFASEPVRLETPRIKLFDVDD